MVGIVLFTYLPFQPIYEVTALQTHICDENVIRPQISHSGLWPRSCYHFSDEERNLLKEIVGNLFQRNLNQCMGAVTLHPLSIHPLSIHPLSIHPLSIHPLSIHPLSIHPLSIHNIIHELRLEDAGT